MDVHWPNQGRDPLPVLSTGSKYLAKGTQKRQVMCWGFSAMGGEECGGCGGCEFELGLLVLEHFCSQPQATVTVRGSLLTSQAEYWVSHLIFITTPKHRDCQLWCVGKETGVQGALVICKFAFPMSIQLEQVFSWIPGSKATFSPISIYMPFSEYHNSQEEPENLLWIKKKKEKKKRRERPTSNMEGRNNLSQNSWTQY